MGVDRYVFGFEDDYFYYYISSYIGGSFVSPEPRSLRGVYHVRDISCVQLCTQDYRTMLCVNVYGRYRYDIRVKTFYLDDFKENRAYYNTLVHNVNNRIKNYNKVREDASNSFVGKFFAISLILFILFMVYLCGIS